MRTTASLIRRHYEPFVRCSTYEAPRTCASNTGSGTKTAVPRDAHPSCSEMQPRKVPSAETAAAIRAQPSPQERPVRLALGPKKQWPNLEGRAFRKIDFLLLCFQKTLPKAIEALIIIVTRNEQGQKLKSFTLRNHWAGICAQGCQRVSFLFTRVFKSTLPCLWLGCAAGSTHTQSPLATWEPSWVSVGGASGDPSVLWASFSSLLPLGTWRAGVQAEGCSGCRVWW